MSAQIGIMIEGQDGLNWERWQRIARTVEDSGYQCLFRSDHFAIGKNLDSLELWTSLTWLASNTERIEFGPLVAPITFRHPSMTVRYAAAVDDLSDGRLVFGMGAGWHEDEHVQWGIPFHDFPTRFAMLEDALELTTRLLNSDEPVSFGGQHFSLKAAVLLPRPQRAGGPPILIGGNGPKRTLPLVARYAKEWNAVYTDIPTYKERAAILNGLLTEQGREQTDVKRSLMTRVVYGRTDSEVRERASKGWGGGLEKMRESDWIVGTGSEIVDKLGEWTEAGVERFMLQWLELDDVDLMEQLASDVLPHFHQ